MLFSRPAPFNNYILIRFYTLLTILPKYWNKIRIENNAKIVKSKTLQTFDKYIHLYYSRGELVNKRVQQKEIRTVQVQVYTRRIYEA